MNLNVSVWKSGVTHVKRAVSVNHVAARRIRKKTFQNLIYRVGTFFCGCEGILCLCFGKSFAHTRRRILCRGKERSKALADKASDGSIFTSLELLTKDAALKAKNGFGRTEPNNYPYLEPPDGRAEFSILNPSGFLTEIVGQRTVSKLCRICKTFSCVFILVGLLVALGYYYQPVKDFLPCLLRQCVMSGRVCKYIDERK